MKWQDKYNELIGLIYIPIIIEMEINYMIIIIIILLLLLINKSIIILSHWCIILWITYIFQYNDCNIGIIIIILICIDIISILQIILLPINIPGNGPWYYLLYQSIMTIIIWWFIIIYYEFIN